MYSWIQKLSHFLGVGPDNTSAAEKLVATFGGFTSICLTAIISHRFTGSEGAAFIVPAMGAATVLLFAVPHGRLSQPWPLFGGNLISAITGVSSYLLIPNEMVAAGAAVGLSIGLMHICRCLHPPGGATAIIAVMGGESITSLGYGFVLTPILLNVICIFIVAVIFNSMFPWRRYPASLMRFTDLPGATHGEASMVIDKEKIEMALEDMDLVVDVTADDLQRLMALSLEHAAKHKLNAAQIRLGHYYTNGLHGALWSVRRIIDEHVSEDPRKDMVIYRVVEGHGLRTSDSCTRSEFAAWAAREVMPAQPPSPENR